MILGAGIYQVPLINKAKELGLYTIVASIPGNYPGFNYSNKNYFIDTTNKEEILKIAIEEKIDGICTTGTDVAVSTIGYVSEKLGLNGNSFESTTLSTNKALMKKTFVENGVITSEFVVVKSADELQNKFYDFNVEKAVLKIVDKSGSRGVVIVDSNTNWNELFKMEINRTSKKYLVLEKYVAGKEIGIDAFIVDSKPIMIVPHEKLMEYVDGTGIPAGHILPFKANKNLIENIRKEIEKIVKALKIKNGALNVDAFIIDGDRVNIIEAGGRAGATGIPEIVSLYTKNDYYELIIKNALNEKISINNNIEDNKKYYASLLLFSDKTGKLKGYSYKEIEGVNFSIDKKSGENVNKIEDGTDRIGMAIIVGNDKEDILNKVMMIKKNFIVMIE